MADGTTTRQYRVLRGSHGRVENGENTIYRVGDVIELTETEAADLGDRVRPAEGPTDTAAPGQYEPGLATATVGATASEQSGPGPTEGEERGLDESAVEAVRAEGGSVNQDMGVEGGQAESAEGAESDSADADSAASTTYDPTDEHWASVRSHIDQSNSIREVERIQRIETEGKARASVLEAAEQRLKELRK